MALKEVGASCLESSSELCVSRFRQSPPAAVSSGYSLRLLFRGIRFPVHGARLRRIKKRLGRKESPCYRPEKNRRGGDGGASTTTRVSE